MPNVGYIARREYAALVRGRLFFVSTLVLAGLAMFVAFLPVAAKLVDRGSTDDRRGRRLGPGALGAHAGRAPGVLDGSGGGFDARRGHRPSRTRSPASLDRDLDAAIVADPPAETARSSFSFHLGETMGQQQIGNLSLGVFGVAVLDYSARNPVSGFVQPLDRRVPRRRRRSGR